VTVERSHPSACAIGHDPSTEIVRQAAEVVSITSFTTAHRWNSKGTCASILAEDQPEGLSADIWLERGVAPTMIRFLADVGATEAITLLDWNDVGITLDPARLTLWRSLVRQTWADHRVPLLLISGCGHADATAEATCLVHPYDGDPRHWFRYRKQVWRARGWSRRTDAIVFRGSTTGNDSEALDERLALALPRTRALVALRESGLPADAAFSSVVQAAPGKQESIEAVMSERGILGQKMPLGAMVNYRYQLMIDGNHGAWSGHVWKLLSGSVNLWVRSSARNWFDGSFEPGTHYIPVRSDGLDLVDRYSAIREDAPMARRIASACRRRARKVFTRRYMLRVQRQQWLAAWRSTIEGPVSG